MRLPILLVILGLAGSVYAWGGFYDPGADTRHWALTRTAIEFVRDRAITRRARAVSLPAALDDPVLIRFGAGNYDAMCAGCHLTPGAKPGELPTGLYPAPPDLTAGTARAPREIFWIIKHGLKMTAMPAWGESMGDAPIAAMTAFVLALPDMTAGEYREWVATSSGHDHGAGEITSDPGVGDAPGDHRHAPGTPPHPH